MKSIEGIGAETLLIVGAVALGFIALKGVKGAASAVTGAVVDAAGNIITGADEAIGIDGPLGFPPGFAGTNDAGVTRWIMDHPNGGYSSAVYRSTATALYGALRMDEGSGTIPPRDSALYEMFPPFSGVSGSW